MKTKYKGKVIRTSGWKSQPEFDKFLSELSVSSLRFLNHEYGKKIAYFRNNYDLYDEENARAYQLLQQDKHMIEEELKHREVQNHGVRLDTQYFDPDTGLVIDIVKGPQYSIAFNESETDYVYNYDNREYSEIEEEKLESSRKRLYDVYKDWNYYDEKWREEYDQEE